jgi:hypothetical protein
MAFRPSSMPSAQIASGANEQRSGRRAPAPFSAQGTVQQAKVNALRWKERAVAGQPAPAPDDSRIPFNQYLEGAGKAADEWMGAFLRTGPGNEFLPPPEPKPFGSEEGGVA